VIDGAGLHEQPLVGRVGAGQLELARGGIDGRFVVRCPGETFGVRPIGIRVDVLVPGPPEEVHEGAEEARRVRQRPEEAQAERLHAAPEQDHGLGAAEDARLTGQPELEGVIPDETVAEGMEGVDGRAGLPVRHEPVDPCLHLVGGLLREGQGEDLLRPRALGGDEPGDAMGDDARLAGARAGQHEQRPVAVRDGPALRAVEAAQEPRHRLQGDRCGGRDRRGRSGQKGQGAGHGRHRHRAACQLGCHARLSAPRGTCAARSASASSAERAVSVPPATTGFT